MHTIKKFLSSLLISALMLPFTNILPAFAGGVPINWESEGKQVSTEPGKLIKNFLSTKVDTYFQEAEKVNNVRLENLQMTCYGDDVFSSVDLRVKDQTIASSTLVKEGKFYVAKLAPSDFEMKRIDHARFHFDFTVKDNLQAPQVAHCGVKDMTFYDVANRRPVDERDVIGGITGNSSMATIGTKAQLRDLIKPFALLRTDGGIETYLGTGTATVELLRKGDPNKYENPDYYVVNIHKFSQGFEKVLHLFNADTFSIQYPIPFYLKLSDKDAEKLKAAANNGKGEIKVRDFNFISNNGQYPWGYMTYVK